MESLTKHSSPKKPIRLQEGTWRYDLRRNWQIYLLFIPVAIYFITFHYAPMFGLAMAFERFKPTKGIFGSQWIWFDNFKDLFVGDTFLLVLRNTTAMALLNLTVGFAAPVILAMLLSEVRIRRFSRTVQVISYMPYFVSAVVVTTLASEFLSSTGALTTILSWFGFDRQNWLANSHKPVFWLINTFIEIWQGAGWGSIIYFAAISNVNGDLHEAAAIDGANRWQRMVHIDIPSIVPTMIILIILDSGSVLSVGFEKIFLMQKSSNEAVSEVISTYTYKMGLQSMQYSFSTAVNLMNTVVNFVMLFLVNFIARRTSEYSLW